MDAEIRDTLKELIMEHAVRLSHSPTKELYGKTRLLNRKERRAEAKLRKAK